LPARASVACTITCRTLAWGSRSRRDRALARTRLTTRTSAPLAMDIVRSGPAGRLSPMDEGRADDFLSQDEKIKPKSTGVNRLRSGTSELAGSRTSCRAIPAMLCRHAGVCSVVNHAGLIRRTARKPCLRWRMKTWAPRDSRMHLLCHRWSFAGIIPSLIV
jgi:hypothetical protein